MDRKRSQDQAFYEIWSLREAYCKYTGEGLSLPLSEYSLSFGDRIRVLRRDQPESCRLHLRLLPAPPSYVLALCAPQTASITFWEAEMQELLEVLQERSRK